MALYSAHDHGRLRRVRPAAGTPVHGPLRAHSIIAEPISRHRAHQQPLRPPRISDSRISPAPARTSTAMRISCRTPPNDQLDRGVYRPYFPAPYAEIDHRANSARSCGSPPREAVALPWVGGARSTAIYIPIWIESASDPCTSSRRRGPHRRPDGIFNRRQQISRFNNTRSSRMGLTTSRVNRNSPRGCAGTATTARSSTIISEQPYGFLRRIRRRSGLPTFEISDRGFNPRFNLSYPPNSDLTTYVSASKGYPPGRPPDQVVAESFCGKAASSALRTRFRLGLRDRREGQALR